VLAAAVLALLARHVREPLAVVPTSPLGKGQLLYVVLLWWVVVGNLMRAIPPFGPERLVTEGVIHLNAVCCTLLVLLLPARPASMPSEGRPVPARSLLELAGVGLMVLVAVTAATSWGTYAVHGSRFVGHAGYHTRFGPDALPSRPKKGEPHP
jgi:hypothetical protein